jgi:hypothetical protein
MIGYKTEYLEVIERAGYDEKLRAKLWKCLCRCGKFTILSTHSITSKRIKSCGCSRKGKTRGNKFGIIHGLSEDPLYKVRNKMMTRCYNAKQSDYPYYQGKGITVCDEWINKPESFIEWAKNNGWIKGLSIDRIDSNKGYSPDNCQFITVSENVKKRWATKEVYPVKKQIKQKLEYCYRCKCTASKEASCKKEK